MRQVMPVAVAVLAALVLCVPEGRAAAAQVPPETFVLEQVSLFKNGFAFFAGHVACPPEAASFQVALPVAPCHGTFWISYPEDLGVVGIVARQTDSSQLVDAVSVTEILQANPDRKVRLTIHDRDVTGVIRYVAKSRAATGGVSGASPLPRSDPSPYFSSYSYRPPEPPQQGSLLIVETDAGELSVDPREVTQVMFLDGKAQRNLARDGKSVALHVRLKKAAPGARMTVSFLARGATWAPSYQIDITDPSLARISAKALVINDACEFTAVDTQLVTGFPHLQFADATSPLSLQQDLAQFLHTLSARRVEPRGVNITSNVMTQRVVYNGPQDTSSMPAYGVSETGQVAEDLFLYPAGRLDLGTREVTYVPLFTESIPYRHVYQWDIPDYVSRQGAYWYWRGEGEPGREEQEEEVWHSIRLTNTTKVPWTTAPGETVKNGVLLGQDTLSYTPLKAQNTLRITRAIGVKAEQVEHETSRKREAVRMYGTTWDLVTVQGDLSVVNFQEKAIDLEIAKTLSGKLKTADPEPKSERLASGIHLMNGRQKLTWSLPLDPGERKALTYTYEACVRP